MNRILLILFFLILIYRVSFSQNKEKIAIKTLNDGRFNIILYEDFSWKYENQDSVLLILQKEDSTRLYNFIMENKFLSCDSSLFWSNFDSSKVWSNGEANYKIYLDTLLIDLLCAGRFVMPHKGNITSKFGWRYGRLHDGTDIQLYIGDTVVAAFDGIVRYTGVHPGYGKVVLIRNFNGLETLYAHLSSIKCAINQQIKAGEHIGLGGRTGHATGPHLHFEIRYKNTPINPEYIIDFEKKELISNKYLIVPKNFEYVKEMNEAQYHIIKSGDTLGAIANRYRTSIKAICKLNNISETSTLSIGQKLRVR